MKKKLIVLFIVLPTMLLLWGLIHYLENYSNDFSTKQAPNLDWESNEYKEDTADTIQQIKELESGLSKEEIKKITESNPNSIYRKLGWYSSLPFESNRCTSDEFNQLRKEHSAEELYMRAGKVGILIMLEEQLYLKSYLKNLVALASKDSLRAKKYKYLLSEFYPAILSLTNNSNGDSEYSILFSPLEKSNKENYRKELISNGMKESEIDEYLHRMALKSPNCLLGVNFDFLELAKKAMAKERAKKIISYISNQAKHDGKLPESIFDLSGDIEKYYTDGHVPDFFIVVHGKEKIELRSAGNDYEENTEDDISYGYITI